MSGTKTLREVLESWHQPWMDCNHSGATSLCCRSLSKALTLLSTWPFLLLIYCGVHVVLWLLNEVSLLSPLQYPVFEGVHPFVFPPLSPACPLPRSCASSSIRALQAPENHTSVRWKSHNNCLSGGKASAGTKS